MALKRKDREELAQARARRAGITEGDPRFPIVKRKTGQAEGVLTSAGEEQELKQVDQETERIEKKQTKGLEQKATLEKEGVFEQFPEETTKLVQPAGTKEGQDQIEAAAQKELFLTNKFKKAFGSASKQELLEGENGEISIGTAVNAALVKIGSETLESVDRGGIVMRAFADKLTFGLIGGRSDIVQNMQSSLETANQQAVSIARDVVTSNMLPNDGFRAINKLENEIDEVEQIIQQNAILSPAVRGSGELTDIERDILEVRQEIFRARQFMAGGAISETDPESLIITLNRLNRDAKSDLKGGA